MNKYTLYLKSGLIYINSDNIINIINYKNGKNIHIKIKLPFVDGYFIIYKYGVRINLFIIDNNYQIEFMIINKKRKNNVFYKYSNGEFIKDKVKYLLS